MNYSAQRYELMKKIEKQKRLTVNIQCEGIYKNEDCIGEVVSIKSDRMGKLKWPNNTRAIIIKDDQHVTMVSGYIVLMKKRFLCFY